MVSNIENALRFYVDGLGFEMTKKGKTRANLLGAGAPPDAPKI